MMTKLDDLRKNIDEIDQKIIALLAQRLNIQKKLECIKRRII
jgi:chorismate mutase